MIEVMGSIPYMVASFFTLLIGVAVASGTLSYPHSCASLRREARREARWMLVMALTCWAWPLWVTFGIVRLFVAAFGGGK